MLIVAGDTNQSIYDRDPQFGEAVLTPEETSQIVRGEDFSLLYIHRLSPSIIRAVQYMMPQMRIFEARRDLTKKMFRYVYAELCLKNEKWNGFIKMPVDV